MANLCFTALDTLEEEITHLAMHRGVTVILGGVGATVTLV
jgi:hypothetical protein